MNIFLFWDKMNDTPEILAEDGSFYSYGEDSVAIKRNEKGGRFWIELESRQDITPLNYWYRYDIFDTKHNCWIPWQDCRHELVRKVRKQAGVKRWKEVY